MSRFSIIVPMLGDQGPFEDTLASVLRYLPHNAQVIVVHDGAYTDPYHLGKEVHFVESDHNHLVSHLNIGLCYAAGEITVLIRPGIELDENWQQGIEENWAAEVGSITPAIVNRSRSSRAVSVGIRADGGYSRRIVGQGKRLNSIVPNKCPVIGPSSWLAAYDTGVLRALAPFDEQLSEHFIDLDIALAIRVLGLKNVVSREFSGLVDDDAEIYQESTQPHGASSRRALHRFGHPSLANILKASIGDILQSPIRAWKFTQALQRIGFNRNKKTDHEYRLKLKQLKLSRAWEKSKNTSTADTYVSYRRAA